MKENSVNNQISQDILATIKVISGNFDIRIEVGVEENNFFAWNQNLINDRKVILPKAFSIAQSRAAGDLAACYLLFHNQKIHQEFSGAKQDLFDAFEKIRVISNVKNLYRGVTKNILQKISEDVRSLSVVESDRFPLLLLREVFADDKFL